MSEVTVTTQAELDAAPVEAVAGGEAGAVASTPAGDSHHASAAPAPPPDDPSGWATCPCDECAGLVWPLTPDEVDEADHG